MLNRRSVPSKSNRLVQNLLVNLGSQSEMITSGRPCSRKTVLTKILAYSSAVTSFVQGAKWTVFVMRSTKTAMAVKPFDSGKSVSRSVVTYAHFRVGISKGWSRPALVLLSDLTS